MGNKDKQAQRSRSIKDSKRRAQRRRPVKNSKMQKKKQKRLPLIAYFVILCIYLELISHIALFGFASFSLNFFFVLAFSGAIGLVLGALCSFLDAKKNFVTTAVITGVLIFYFGAQIVYKSVFQKCLALFRMLNVADQALDFVDVIFKNILRNLIFVILLILPMVLLFLLKRRIRFRRTTITYKAICAGSAAAIHIALLLIMLIGGDSAYSPYDIYHHDISVEMTAETFGVLTMTRLDLKYAIFGTPEKSGGLAEETFGEQDGSDLVIDESQEPEYDTSPNILDIDFDAITANAPNKNVVEMTQYFQSQSGTNKNQYTGMFEGYNVIFITAEGFSKYVIDEERTPTLYRLKNEGFVFNNYYTPGWYASTSDGEYANLSGLLPTDGVVSMKQTGKNGNNMYFTLGKQLGRLGYTCNGYHNNSYTYYGRDKSHPNMGYAWWGTGNWFQAEKNSEGKALWPQSDLELMKQSIDMYIDQQPFHTYYMTVSGHMVYEWSGNYQAYKNKSEYKDLPYSEVTKGYIACQSELEKAMTYLVERLEEAGIADKTVIVLSADHIPYNDKPISDELAGHELDSEIEWYQNDLIIWSGSMEEPVVVDKYCYDVDILPTISNLLGLEYDSRLMIGQDILSDSAQLVCFPTRSFITDKCIYNAKTKEVTPLTDEPVTDEYIKNMQSVVYNKFLISTMILDEDYYKYIDQQLSSGSE